MPHTAIIEALPTTGDSPSGQHPVAVYLCLNAAMTVREE